MNSDKLIVALDTADLKAAESLVKTLSPAVKRFKVGKELFTAAGPQAIEMVRSQGGKVFLDLKFHDIPNTVAAACRAAVAHGVFMLNVHALGGGKMLTQAAGSVKKAAVELKKKRPYLVAVTVLTSLTGDDLKTVGVEKTPKEEVLSLARLSKQCGLDGIVASGEELSALRSELGADFLIVTPGVRPAASAAGDQKRVVTPKEALQKGASFIVVGRPITQAKDPAEAAEKILNEING